jgi:hypothetical protein
MVRFRTSPEEDDLLGSARVFVEATPSHPNRRSVSPCLNDHDAASVRVGDVLRGSSV